MNPSSPAFEKDSHSTTTKAHVNVAVAASVQHSLRLPLQLEDRSHQNERHVRRTMSSRRAMLIRTMTMTVAIVACNLNTAAVSATPFDALQQQQQYRHRHNDVYQHTSTSQLYRRSLSAFYRQIDSERGSILPLRHHSHIGLSVRGGESKPQAQDPDSNIQHDDSSNIEQDEVQTDGADNNSQQVTDQDGEVFEDTNNNIVPEADLDETDQDRLSMDENSTEEGVATSKIKSEDEVKETIDGGSATAESLDSTQTIVSVGDQNLSEESEYDSDYSFSGCVSNHEQEDDHEQASIGVEVLIQEEHTMQVPAVDVEVASIVDVESIHDDASQLRIKGKELHDQGDFTQASQSFQQAANKLQIAITNLSISVNSDGASDSLIDVDHEIKNKHQQLIEERATCRLHEALCHLKNEQYALSVESCTDVLMDGVQIVYDYGTDSVTDNDGDQEGSENPKEPPTASIRVLTNQESSSTSFSSSGSAESSSIKTTTLSPSTTAQLSPAVRARAYHRRAKARLALGDTSGALEDSRSAAFLGERNAVKLYGRLMREQSGSSSLLDAGLGLGGANSGFGGADSTLNDLFGSLASSSSGSPFGSFLNGSPLSGPGSASTSGPGDSMSILSSLLSGSGASGLDSSSSQDMPMSMPFNPLSMLGSMGGGNSAGGEGGMGSLAKSVLSSVAKKAEDKSTQESICNYLNGLDTAQIISLSSMAGMPLSKSTAGKLASFANGLTPRGIAKSVKLTKRILFVGSLMRKIFQVIGKYKHILVLIVLIGWTKSAIQRPVVLGKKAAKKIAEAAISKATFVI